MPDQLQSDHDALITLVESVKNIKTDQDKFHGEMKESFADLKYNLAARLSKVETGLSNTDKVFIAKAEQDKRDTLFNERIGTLESWQNKIIGALIFINILLGLAVAYFHR